MSVRSKLKLLAKLRNKEYRDAYVEEHVKTSLPFQIKALRDQRSWTQGKLANEARTTQTAISRIENPDYGNLSLNSLYKLAAAFDVALLVKFVPFSRLLDEFEDGSPEALEVKSFEEELPELEHSAVGEMMFGTFSKTQKVNAFHFHAAGSVWTAEPGEFIKTSYHVDATAILPPVRTPGTFIPVRVDVLDVSTGLPM